MSRKRAAQFVRAVVDGAERPARAIALILDLAVSTVGRWWVRSGFCGQGRPRLGDTRANREVVRQAVRERGGSVSIRALQGRFPGVGRRLIAQERAIACREIQIARVKGLERLKWRRPGTVWAIDHTAPRRRQAEPALCVRDLGSGLVLASALHRDMTATDVLTVLQHLVDDHGEPLRPAVVLDEGSNLMFEMLPDGHPLDYSSCGSRAGTGTYEAFINSNDVGMWGIPP